MENYMKYVEINQAIMFGKPVIKGTRITIEAIIDELGSGKSFDDIAVSYPGIGQNEILAALKFASDALKGERTYAIAV
jgi:uncharacterized protein (DUF433 family)